MHAPDDAAAALRLHGRGDLADRRREAPLLLHRLRPRPRGAARADRPDRHRGHRAMPASAHVTPDGVLNPCEMDVVVNWRRPSVCEIADAIRSADRLPGRAHRGRRARQRTLPARHAARLRGGRRAGSRAGDDRRSRGRAATIRERLLRGPRSRATACSTTACAAAISSAGRARPSAPAAVTVTDQVAPGPPLNLAAEYFDPGDPDRAGSDDARVGQSRCRGRRSAARGGCRPLDLAGQPAAAVSRISTSSGSTTGRAR